MAFGFSLSHKTKDIKRDWNRLTQTGGSTFDSGNALTDTEVGTLRGYNADYQQRLKDPLGAVGRGIFSRARGALSDVAAGRQSAFGARLAQLAAQSGGNLSPEAQAQLQQQNQREINQQLFTGNAELANTEATMTLSETSKLFDRMEGISRTILGVGEARSNRGLQALIQAILGRQALAFGKTAAAAQIVGTAIGAGGLAAGASGGGAATNPYTGQH